MRSVPGLLSVFLIAAGVACAELPPDLPPASPLPFAPGPVIGGTIKGNPDAGIVPVKDLIEANRKDCLLYTSIHCVHTADTTAPGLTAPTQYSQEKPRLKRNSKGN